MGQLGRVLETNFGGRPCILKKEGSSAKSLEKYGA